jgi:seryl-tRNA synthetase
MNSLLWFCWVTGALAVITLLDRLYRVNRKLKEILMNQKEATEKLQKVSNQLGKVGEETATLLKNVEDLKTALENSKEVSPELQAAVDQVASQAALVDDKVPDAPLPPTEGTGSEPTPA